MTKTFGVVGFAAGWNVVSWVPLLKGKCYWCKQDWPNFAGQRLHCGNTPWRHRFCPLLRKFSPSPTEYSPGTLPVGWNSQGLWLKQLQEHLFLRISSMTARCIMLVLSFILSHQIHLWVISWHLDEYSVFSHFVW